MVTLGEMTTWLPVPGAIPQFCARFVDDALGFAVGWNVRALPDEPLYRIVCRKITDIARIGISAQSLSVWTSVQQPC